MKTLRLEIPRDFVDYLIERLILRSSKNRRLTRKILKAQHTLRLAVPAEGWDAYLELERLVNERAADQFDDLLRATLDFAAWRGSYSEALSPVIRAADDEPRSENRRSEQRPSPTKM